MQFQPPDSTTWWTLQLNRPESGWTLGTKIPASHACPCPKCLSSFCCILHDKSWIGAKQICYSNIAWAKTQTKVQILNTGHKHFWYDAIILFMLVLAGDLQWWEPTADPACQVWWACQSGRAGCLGLWAGQLAWLSLPVRVPRQTMAIQQQVHGDKNYVWWFGFG